MNDKDEMINLLENELPVITLVVYFSSFDAISLKRKVIWCFIFKIHIWSFGMNYMKTNRPLMKNQSRRDEKYVTNHHFHKIKFIYYVKTSEEWQS